MKHEDSPLTAASVMDPDFVGEPADAKPVKTPLRPEQFIESHIPDVRPPADPENPVLDLGERIEVNKAEVLEAVQRALWRSGRKGVRAVDFRILKHWNQSLGISKGDQHPQNKTDDEQWNRAYKSNPDLFDTTGADDDDYLILVQFPGTLDLLPMRLRRVRQDSL